MTSKIDEIFEKAEKDLNYVKTELDIPYVPIKDQKIVVIYFVVDDNNNQIMKIWGAFDTDEDAKSQIDIFKNKVGNDIFDAYVLQMYGLATRPPESDDVKQKYNEEELQKLVNKFDEQKKKVNQTFDTREDVLDTEEEERERMTNELKGIKTKNPIKNEEINYENLLHKLEKPPTHFDPKDELTDYEKQECLNKSNNIINTYYSDELNKKLDLTKEKDRVPNQNWALVSFTGSDCNQKTVIPGIIFWGVFETFDDVQKHVPYIKKSGLDIAVLELYTWIAIPPNDKYMSSQDVHDNHLIDVLKHYKKKVQYKKELFEYRKKKLKDNPDMNQYNQNKKVFKELHELFGQIVVENESIGLQNEEAFRKVFKNQKRLPEFTIVRENTEEEE